MLSSLSERVPYDAIVDRPPLELPGGARLAVWLIVNIESWEIKRPMPRTVLPPPLGAPLLPDLPNWAWHEYGMRVGFWRFFEALIQTKYRSHARAEWIGVSALSARVRSCTGRRLGIYGTRLCADPDA